MIQSRVSEKFGKHPKGLYLLFFTEMWERFSFYGMRALLVYYMMKQLMFSQEQSSSIYGFYTGFVYFTPFFGGIIADRWLGQRRTVILGGTLMAIGHFMMASETLFFPALAFLIAGNGCFKPNISTQVGNLYAEGDPRRDSAFSIFYMGINLGAFFSPLICGTLGEVYGWHYGFGAAGIGMVLGLIIYIWGQKKYLGDDRIMQKNAGTIKDEPLQKDDYGRIGALIVLAIFTIVFWCVYEQQGNTLALWADANTDRHIFMLFGSDWEMPASWFQSINPMFIFIFTPLITTLWAWQGRRGKEPSSVTKMGAGTILLGMSFIVMIGAAQAFTASGKVSAWWLVGCIFVLTIGEIYMSPVGLSLVTKVSPAKLVSMMMGMWFLADFFGNYMAGYVGTYWDKMSKESYFLMLACLAFAAGIGILLMLKPLKKYLSKGATSAL